MLHYTIHSSFIILMASTFGGSIFMSADTYSPLVYRAALSHRQINSTAWLKQAEIDYLKPVYSN